MTLLRADRALRRGATVVIVDGDAAASRAWTEAARNVDAEAIVLDVAAVADLPAALVKGPRIGAGVAAFVCRDMTCLPRIDTRAALEAAVVRAPQSARSPRAS